MKIKSRSIAKNKSVIVTAIITFLTIFWNIVDVVSNLEFIARKAGYDSQWAKFWTSPATPKIAFFLAVGGLVWSLLFEVKKNKQVEGSETEERQIHNNPELNLISEKTEERIFTDAEPGYLSDFFEEHTDAQATKPLCTESAEI
jgi:hypothetical protein